MRRVEPAKDLHRTPDGLGHLLEVCDVCHEYLGARPPRPDGGRGVRETVGVDIHKRHGRSGRGEGDGAGLADA